MTHQEIADGIDEIATHRAYAIQDLDRRFGLLIKALRRKCGEVGHVFRPVHGCPRSCSVCGTDESEEA